MSVCLDWNFGSRNGFFDCYVLCDFCFGLDLSKKSFDCDCDCYFYFFLCPVLVGCRCVVGFDCDCDFDSGSTVLEVDFDFDFVGEQVKTFFAD